MPFSTQSPFVAYPSQPSPSPFRYNLNASTSTSHYPEAPSSDPPEELEARELYPTVADWLQELDQGHRGSDKQDFAQYADSLTLNGFLRVDSLLSGITADMLTKTCTGMSLGVAFDILKYAEKDVRRIQKRQKSRHHFTYGS